jgi:hypothetical protein
VEPEQPVGLDTVTGTPETGKTFGRNSFLNHNSKITQRFLTTTTVTFCTFNAMNLLDSTEPAAHKQFNGPELGNCGNAWTSLASHVSYTEPSHAPDSIDELGVTVALVEQILLKVLYFRGELMGRELAVALGVKFPLIHEQIERLKLQHLVEVKRSNGVGFLGTLSSVFALTEAGRDRAQFYLELSQYAGPLPVPLNQYEAMVRKQRLRHGWLKRDQLERAYRRMVITPAIFSQLGPAVNAGCSFLIYGKPGNGKTHLAEGLAALDNSAVLLPYAIEYQGCIVQVYDPVYHTRLEENRDSDSFAAECDDGRWARCRRPFIASGGELSMEMLNLSYNSVSKIYEAPLHVKANNGIYLVDDFGRQRATPAEVLNRWIVPMEKRVDYLNLQTGGKITVPFEVFLVFSTNLKPDQLGDEAFLRRLQYKMFLHNPDAEEFSEIFRRFCADHRLPCQSGLVEWLIEKHYRDVKRRFRRCHPRDVVMHAINFIEFSGRPYELTEEILDHAFESCFPVEDLDD